MSADRAGSAGRDFAVPGTGVRRSEGGLCQMVWFGALAQHLAAVSGEVALEFAALQAAATSIVSCSTCPPPIGGSRPSSR